MKSYPGIRTTDGKSGHLSLLAVAFCLAGACAIDDGTPAGDGSTSTGAADGGADVGADVQNGGDDGGLFDAPSHFDLGRPMTEAPLVVTSCPASPPPPAGGVCCASALGFEDNSTMHFLTPGCCAMALSKPTVTTAPTACGRGALRMEADFRAREATSQCGERGEAEACSLQVGETSRAVLAPLDLTGLTLSAMLYLEGPPLPSAAAQGRLFVLGRAGVVDGPAFALPQLSTWMRVDLPFPADGSGRGADVRILGVRVDFGGQAWTGRLYVDELTWR